MLTAGAAPAAHAAPADEQLLAHWTFDEVSGIVCRDASGRSNHAEPAQPAAIGFRHVEGIFGAALHFAGNHHLRVPGGPRFGDLEQVSLGAWVLPDELGNYREIFRKEDGDRRVLFSFQNNGTILSLGLNIDGYVECDATLDPKQVLDGAWHHCAATFDGHMMRVYLDGKEIGSLERKGIVRTGDKADGCIGSTNGGECFQGAIDELRIASQALSAQQIERLFRHGLQAQAAAAARVDESLGTVYVKESTFAATAAGCRQRLAENPHASGLRLARAAAVRLRADFPADYDRFAGYLGADPAEYLLAAGNEFHHRVIGRLVELAVEYRPLTEQQWRRQTPEQAAHWKQVEPIERHYEQLRGLGDAARHSPAWIDLVFAAGPLVQFRPSVREAVAPYQSPATPPTRDLSADEARSLLERDWLHQADGEPTAARIRDEIRWARALAARLGEAYPGTFECKAELAQLDALDAQAAALAGADRLVYFRVRELKRAIALRNPAIDFDTLLFVDMPFPQGSEWRHETRHRLGYMAVPGARLLVLEGLGPDGRVRQLMPQAPLHGSFWRPDVSCDGQRVLFCFKPHNEKSFHLYEIGVDGSGLVQLTDGPYDDLDPIYLPDGHIIFSTTRGNTYVRCMPPTNAYVLARCDADGRNVYLISRNNEPDYLPSVMHDGRVIYTRWEYTDKPVWRAQGLWTVNPDGTQVNTFWGNQTVWPDLLKDARSIPGSRRVMFTGSAHHDWFAGSVGIIDPDRGFNFPDGLTKVTADVSWPESGNGPVDPVESPDYHRSGHYRAYYSPYPLSERDFLVSAERGGRFALYLMDVFGNRELIYEGEHNILHAMPLGPRQRPPVVADRVDWPTPDQRQSPSPGIIYSGNVYAGAPDVLRGQARFLRVLNIDHKTYTYWHQRPYVSTGPVVSAVQSDGVKRILGAVPIEADGSVAFHAPSGVPLHFQLLDEQGRALQTMRSFTGVMPGERRGCLGCHESHSRAPDIEGKTIALVHQPRDITPPAWGNESVSYPRFVAPVLKRHCGGCHQGDGEGRKTLDLTERPGFHVFSEPYLLLIGRPTWGQPYVPPQNPPPGFGLAGMLMVEGYHQRDPAAYRTSPPMTALSYRSRLVHRAASGEHHDVKVDPDGLARLIAWVDTMCPYQGEEEIRQTDDPVFQGVDWLSIRPRVRTAPTIVRPGPVDGR
jgi:hypothetical protein